MNALALATQLTEIMAAIAEEWPDIPKVTDLDEIDADAKGSAWNRAYGRYWGADTILGQIRKGQNT
jgi:hypothetical protein